MGLFSNLFKKNTNQKSLDEDLKNRVSEVLTERPASLESSSKSNVMNKIFKLVLEGEKIISRKKKKMNVLS